MTVKEGAVKVTPSIADSAPSIAESIAPGLPLIRAGQQLNIHGDATEVRLLAPAQLTRSLAWREGQIYFKDDRLADVVDELNRYSGLSLVVENDGAREFAIAGTFETNAEGVEALLVSLKDGFGLNVRQEGRKVYISKH